MQVTSYVTNAISECYIYFCKWRDNGIVKYSKLKGGRVGNYQIPEKLIYKASGRTMTWCPVGMLIREHIALQSGMQPPFT